MGSSSGRLWESPAGGRRPDADVLLTTHPVWPIVAGLFLAGVLVRVAALCLAPGHGFLSDHVDYMAWARYAYEHGPTSLYDLPAGSLVNVRLPPWLAGRFVVTPFPSYSRCNYPPLSACLFWLQGALWTVLDEHVVERPVLPEIAAEVGYQGGPISSRVANTITARFVNAVPSLLVDLLLSVGVAALVRTWKAGSTSRKSALWAFALAWLTPPVWLDSAFWCQTDSWPTCLLVWCLVCLARERWAWAGALFGVALLLKAQALLCLPLLGFVLLAQRVAPGGSWRHSLRLWRFALAALLLVVSLSAPFMLAVADTPFRPWLWVERAYLEPVLAEFPFTTLKAFNVWWLDFLAYGGNRTALDSRTVAWGLSKDALGRVVFLISLLVSGVLCARRWKWQPASWTAFAALSLLSAFLFPTRVHERYIYYCLPFVMAGAVWWRAWRPALVGLLLTATLEMTWYLWYAEPSAAPWAGAQATWARSLSIGLAGLNLACFFWLLFAVARRERTPAAEREPGPTGSGA